MLAYLVILLAFAVDRFSKWWVAAYLAEHGPTTINRWLALRATFNKGISFGLFQGIGPVVGWLSILIILGLLYYLTRLPRQERAERFGLALVIGGALGNLVDRVVAGEVLDFLETPFRPGVFNAADLFINVGMAIFVVSTLLESRRRKHISLSEDAGTAIDAHDEAAHGG